MTAAQIADHFEKEAFSVGRATIYRHLDKLTEGGNLRRYTTDGVSGACYQYMDGVEDSRVHLHLKCEECGNLQHLPCDPLNELHRHILDKHDFEVNALKTVLYGKCSKCFNNV